MPKSAVVKSIGWALRKFSKTNAYAVVSFIEQQSTQGLAKREGLKWLSKTSSSLIAHQSV
ncbi:DNA alkylation repair protein [Vibrio nereis]|uniref:Uncharacterized protein n=1 Tax=Vibrio nereis TaxID=693 RepID=A0A0M0HQF2_VIBNE|nr:DNA alkylation repair protein [Vibrio nereis]KOO04271.1 hypothetical protein AKJ17_05015 [Vibrio nereis]